jgi:D-arabinose 1-dehydrogenase-like Zn-dependent alcohol dehydrogenase
MKVLVIGAGHVGGAAVEALTASGNEVIAASRSAAHSVDAREPESVAALFAAIGKVDAIVAALGSAPFKPLADLTRDDFIAGYFGKVQTQLDIVEIGTPYLADGGSFTLTAAAVGQAYVKAVQGVQTGQVYALDGQ